MAHNQFMLRVLHARYHWPVHASWERWHEAAVRACTQVVTWARTGCFLSRTAHRTGRKASVFQRRCRELVMCFAMQNIEGCMLFYGQWQWHKQKLRLQACTTVL